MGDGIGQSIMAPFQDSYDMWYMGYGAIGGAVRPYIGSLLSGNTAKLDLILTGYGLESALAGAVTNYLFLVFGSPDTLSIGKGVLLGFGGSWVWDKFIRQMFVKWGLISA